MSENYFLVEDKLKGLCWRTRELELIPVKDLNHSHLRNIALFLMGFGMTRCNANEIQRIAWLTILRKEWERRILNGEILTDDKVRFTKTRMLHD